MSLVIHDPRELRELCRGWARTGATLGLVPTMGNLHAGHVSLMRRASAQCDQVVVSIFVNPKQFGPREDYAAYPRTLEADQAICDKNGAGVVFAPSADDMYPEGFATTVSVAGLTEGLCGASRPGHFDGVATVCARLHGLVLPTRAYYGEKDWQQLQVVRRMNEDLGFGATVVGVPTVREDDGLALSSRNQYLGAEEREAALCLWTGLQAARFEEAVADAIAGEPLAELEYVSLVDPTSLVPMARLDETGRLLVAARVGPARLIDNIALVPGGE